MQEERIIRRILLKRGRNIAVDLPSLKKFKEALEQQIKLPAKLKPIGQFSWEEYYLSQLSEDKEKYEQLKKVRPTSNDLYSLSKIDDFMDIDHGLFGRLTRLSDKKRFSMPLVEFEFVDKDSKTFDLLDDYRYWFINYK